MSIQGALFATAVAPLFFDRFEEHLEEQQQALSSAAASGAPAAEAEDDDDVRLTKSQSDHLITLLRQWYVTLSATAGLSNTSPWQEASSREGRDAHDRARRKRTRSFSFLRAECGEAYVQLPHTRLIPSEWQPATVLSSAPLLAGSLAMWMHEYKCDERTTTLSSTDAAAAQLLAKVVASLACLSPLYEAFFVLFCYWYSHHREALTGKMALSELAGPRGRRSRGATVRIRDVAAPHLRHAVSSFISEWLAHMRAQASSQSDVEGDAASVQQEHCVSAVQSLFPAPDADEARTTISLAPAILTGAAELCFVECERLASDGQPRAFGSGVLPITRIATLLHHVEKRIDEAMEACLVEIEKHSSDAISPCGPPRRQHLRVGTLVGQCREDPRRLRELRAVRTGGDARSDDAFNDVDEEDDIGHEDEMTTELEDLDSISSLDSYSVISDGDEPEEDSELQEETRVGRHSARGRPPQTTIQHHVPERCPEAGDVPLTDAWRRHVSQRRRATLLSPVLTTYLVDVAESCTVPADGGCRLGEREQCVLFAGAGVHRPEYVAHHGALNWFAVGRPQRHPHRPDAAP